MTKISNIEKLQPEVAKVIIDADGQNRRAIKKDAINDLQQMLASGQITKEEFKNARKVLRDGNVMGAIAAGNRMDETQQLGQLQNKKAQALLETTGLSVDDLYKIANEFAGADNQISYTHLNLSEKKRAKAGGETSSERYNVLNALNDRIKANGGDKVLTMKEAKTLMKGLGCDFEIPVNPAQAAFSIIHPVALGLSIAESVKKETPFGPQGGVEGGQGSVTNKAEAKMKALENAAQEVKPEEE